MIKLNENRPKAKPLAPVSQLVNAKDKFLKEIKKKRKKQRNKDNNSFVVQFSSVQSLSRVQLLATP